MKSKAFRKISGTLSGYDISRSGTIVELDDVIPPSLTSFATMRGVTVRHLPKLFEAEGRTFSDYVLERRLERARQLLLNPAVTPRPISTIAFDLGFGDLSYFNRTFKKRFGVTPRETRARSIALVNASDAAD